MNIQSNNNILLTGAGFTHNFGAPLADGMWSGIFNNENIYSFPELKRLLLCEFDYEKIYYKVKEGNYRKELKDVLENAIISAYDNLNKSFLCEGDFLKNVINILNKFCGKNNTRGYVFTLNQDLFLEYKYVPEFVNIKIEKPFIPGIKNYEQWFNVNSEQKNENIKLPNEDELKIKKQEFLETTGKFFYIKLHGSSKWISSDGSNKLVIGRNKEWEIAKEPLLKWYFEIFREVLSQKQRKLLIIGYSFRDKHINKVISEAIEESNLKVYIICPESPEDFKKRFFNVTLEESKIMPRIWDNLCGYYPCKLSEIFKDNTSEYTFLGKSFFENYFN